jgi:HSP20 family molecular chaperone IbpA
MKNDDIGSVINNIESLVDPFYPFRIRVGGSNIWPVTDSSVELNKRYLEQMRNSEKVKNNYGSLDPADFIDASALQDFLKAMKTKTGQTTERVDKDNPTNYHSYVQELSRSSHLFPEILVNCYIGTSAVIYEIPVSGVSKDSISVKNDLSKLVVSWDRGTKSFDNMQRVYSEYYPTTKCQRTIPLPKDSQGRSIVETSGVSASVKDGILTITFKMKERNESQQTLVDVKLT